MVFIGGQEHLVFKITEILKWDYRAVTKHLNFIINGTIFQNLNSLLNSGLGAHTQGKSFPYQFIPWGALLNIKY